MSLRFFADHCIPNSIIRGLQNAGHEVLRLRDYLPTDSPDGLVISKAQELDCILVSLNGDFADILAYPPDRYNGILSLHLRNHPETIPQLLDRLNAYLSTYDDMKHYMGKLLVAETHRIRSRG